MLNAIGMHILFQHLFCDETLVQRPALRSRFSSESSKHSQSWNPLEMQWQWGHFCQVVPLGVPYGPVVVEFTGTFPSKFFESPVYIDLLLPWPWEILFSLISFWWSKVPSTKTVLPSGCFIRGLPISFFGAASSFLWLGWEGTTTPRASGSTIVSSSMRRALWSVHQPLDNKLKGWCKGLCEVERWGWQTGADENPWCCLGFHCRASKVTTYLLESSRVVVHGGHERTYHCFYASCQLWTAKFVAIILLYHDCNKKTVSNAATFLAVRKCSVVFRMRNLPSSTCSVTSSICSWQATVRHEHVLLVGLQ